MRASMETRTRATGDLVAVAKNETIHNHAAFMWSVADLLRREPGRRSRGRREKASWRSLD
jgi:hypothetical protein